MSQHSPRFTYRIAALLVLLAGSLAMLVQQRALAGDTLAVPSAPAIMALPDVSVAPASVEIPQPQPTRNSTKTRSTQRKTMVMEVTAYCPCKICCGPNAQGITASGRKISHNNGAFVAADTQVLPFHTRLSIPGYRSGKVVPVIDRGGDIKGNRIDVFFKSHQEATKFGRRVVPVTVLR